MTTSGMFESSTYFTSMIKYTVVQIALRYSEVISCINIRSKRSVSEICSILIIRFDVNGLYDEK
jgi:hypothetical protein